MKYIHSIYCAAFAIIIGMLRYMCVSYTVYMIDHMTLTCTPDGSDG